MTPADRRISELIDKWLTSIDLHLQYVELSDAAYARVQPWPKHDRPTRWVLEVARQKALELKSHVEARQAMGDSKFAESLELMAFLANLVGLQNIQRFIPLADPAKAAAAAGTSQTVEMPAAAAPQRARSASDDATREMPRLKVPPQVATQAEPPPKAHTRATPPPKASAPKPTHAPARATTAKPAASPSADMKTKIVADAVRLMKWGKEWHELADLIARIADRPPASEVRKVLRAHRAEIEEKARKKEEKTGKK